MKAFIIIPIFLSWMADSRAVEIFPFEFNLRLDEVQVDRVELRLNCFYLNERSQVIKVSSEKKNLPIFSLDRKHIKILNLHPLGVPISPDGFEFYRCHSLFYFQVGEKNYSRYLKLNHEEGLTSQVVSKLGQRVLYLVKSTGQLKWARTDLNEKCLAYKDISLKQNRVNWKFQYFNKICNDSFSGYEMAESSQFEAYQKKDIPLSIYYDVNENSWVSISFHKRELSYDEQRLIGTSIEGPL